MNPQQLQQQFVSYASHFCKDAQLSTKVFSDLLSRYNEPHRHYHTPTHIIAILADAEAFFQGNIPDELFFGIWFHDAIYEATSSKNEERSAELAIEALTKMNALQEVVNKCSALIRKTADHFNAAAEDEVTQFFMDADLKILGSDDNTYQEYLKAVRKEYASLPTIVFNMGRRKFLRKALRCEKIFRTQQYCEKYEQAARKNLLNELNQLQ